MESASILIVDNARLWRNFSKQTLEAAGYSVFAPTSVSEAINLMSRHDFSLVLIDHLILHSSDAQHLLESTRSNPTILALAAAPSTREARDFLKMGMVQDYEQKPFASERLIGLVEERLAANRCSS